MHPRERYLRRALSNNPYQVNHRLHAIQPSRQGIGLGHVASPDLHRQTAQRGKIGRAAYQTAHLVPQTHQSLRHATANEPRGAGQQHMHME